MVGGHAVCCPIEATTCTHMHMCTSAMLARSGRRGGGLFDRAVSDNCRMLVEAKSRVCGRHAQSLLRKARGGSAHDHEHDLGATAGVRARSWAAAARTVAQGGRRRAQLRRGGRRGAQAVPPGLRRRFDPSPVVPRARDDQSDLWPTRGAPQRARMIATHSSHREPASASFAQEPRQHHQARTLGDCPVGR